jgi:hypothetical protein
MVGSIDLANFCHAGVGTLRGVYRLVGEAFQYLETPPQSPADRQEARVKRGSLVHSFLRRKSMYGGPHFHNKSLNFNE